MTEKFIYVYIAFVLILTVYFGTKLYKDRTEQQIAVQELNLESFEEQWGSLKETLKTIKEEEK